ncbi:hypothetical protein [Halorubrum yunnanense]|uniref:Uncharacterized protein n=1 Tax=Halorubrum yunnanense TaxID=1526162 RepID=A0ABD5YLY8_9EURY|nr:hypothetical protein [Halorubrum yunnanense]
MGKIADQLQAEVEAYLIAGGAMALQQPSLKDTDPVVVDETALRHLMGVLADLGYEEVTDIGEELDCGFYDRS